MDGIQTVEAGKARRRLAGGLGLLAVGALAGGILAGTLSAAAAGNSSSVPTSTGGSSVAAAWGAAGGPGGAAPARSDERALASTNAAKIRTAALKAVPGGTIYRIETDAGDGMYEAHMTKADGTRVPVKFDASFSVTKVEDGMGTGDPSPPAPTGGGGNA